MTGARRRQKLKLCNLAAALAIVVLAGPAVVRLPASAATTERIVVHTLSGLALGGFDPVAYFTDRTPQLGNGAHEATYRGVVWRFRNEGNQAAFVRNPDVYLPGFGGYDPVAVARGVAVPGHPLVWLVSGNRLYLFSTPENRAAFAAQTQQIIAAAVHHWPDVAAKLVP
jgi:YHS domain-containing protein